MMKTGVIGLGDMGSGLAKNLISNGFETRGYDLSEKRLTAFAEMGGSPAPNAGDVGIDTDAVFVMVMNGDQAKDVILGDHGLIRTMPKNGCILLTATIKPREAREIGDAMAGSGIHLIDSPVSGGFPGAQGGDVDHDGSRAGHNTGPVSARDGSCVCKHPPCWPGTRRWTNGQGLSAITHWCTVFCDF